MNIEQVTIYSEYLTPILFIEMFISLFQTYFSQIVDKEIFHLLPNSAPVSPTGQI